jgi:hypothetical protein
MDPSADCESFVLSSEPQVGNIIYRFDKVKEQDLQRDSEESSGSSTLKDAILPCNHQLISKDYHLCSL